MISDKCCDFQAAGDSIVVWKNGKIVKVPAAKILVSR
jgi:hypothetical protein